jgi:hypothetical protein
LVFFQPGGSLQCLFVASGCQLPVAVVVEFLYVQQDEIGQCEQSFDIFIPDASVGVDTDMYACFFQIAEQGNQLACLEGRFSTAESDSSFLSERFDGTAKGFWLTAIFRISSGEVSLLSPLASIVSGLAQ